MAFDERTPVLFGQADKAKTAEAFQEALREGGTDAKETALFCSVCKAFVKAEGPEALTKFVGLSLEARNGADEKLRDKEAFQYIWKPTRTERKIRRCPGTKVWVLVCTMWCLLRKEKTKRVWFIRGKNCLKRSCLLPVKLVEFFVHVGYGWVFYNYANKVVWI